TPGNEQIARRAAEAFIAKRVRPSERVAVFGLPGPGPQLGFTADRTRAVAELQKVRGALERNMTTPLGRLSQQEAYEIANGNDRGSCGAELRRLLRIRSEPPRKRSAGEAAGDDDAGVRDPGAGRAARQPCGGNGRRPRDRRRVAPRCSARPDRRSVAGLLSR